MKTIVLSRMYYNPDGTPVLSRPEEQTPRLGGLVSNELPGAFFESQVEIAGVGHEPGIREAAGGAHVSAHVSAQEDERPEARQGAHVSAHVSAGKSQQEIREIHYAIMKAKECPYFQRDPGCGCVDFGRCGLGVVQEHRRCYRNPDCLDCVRSGGWEKVLELRASRVEISGATP